MVAEITGSAVGNQSRNGRRDMQPASSCFEILELSLGGSGQEPTWAQHGVGFIISLSLAGAALPAIRLSCPTIRRQEHTAANRFAAPLAVFDLQSLESRYVHSHMRRQVSAETCSLPVFAPNAGTSATSEKRSYTMSKQSSRTRGLRPFVKGDPRINRKGRPRSYDELRKLAQAIAHETTTDNQGNEITTAVAILRSWARSKQPSLQIAFIEYAYGSPPSKIETSGPDGKALKPMVIQVVTPAPVSPDRFN